MNDIPDLDRGDETKQRLIAAGLMVFGRDGYEGASTRRLAAEAGANVAAIAYHFGGKWGLYIAVARQVAQRNGAVVGPLSERVAAELAAAAPGPDALARIVARVIGGLMDGLFTLREDGRAAFLIREMLAPSEAFDVLYEGFFLPLNRMLSALAATALGLSPDEPAAVMRGHLLLGTVMPLIAGRVVIERRLGWSEITPERRRQAIAMAVAAACSSLALPPPDILD
ncbi:MAG: CerR family C-terminal domain-containing protein [Alphaproteobacteria bacterium]|nr:CerR family C-terminal domain-containing protein [Alphaproteobacteria bacterium]